jgi:hypothetical protein
MSSDANQATAADAPGGGPRRRLWWERPTIRALRREQVGPRDYTAPWDARENDSSRLPEDDSVHLGGLVLTEAFTPSTVSNLYTALDRLPLRNRHDDDWRDRLTRSRTAGGGGWQSLGVLRRPGDPVFGTGGTAPDLPEAVSAVWLSLHYDMPSVAVLVATFTLNEEEGDLSALLRQDRRTEYLDSQITVHGRLGSLRRRIPWARPPRYNLSSKISNPKDQKRRSCESEIERHEDACLKWFVNKFPGRFAEAEPHVRPYVRLLLTKEAVPFEGRDSPLEPVGLDWQIDLWRSSAPEGWALTFDRWPHRSRRRFKLVVAARRRDAAREQNDEAGETNWYLTQRFSTDQSALASRYALYALLNLYADRLATLRDRGGSKWRSRRPVLEARSLDDYLSRDGLDVATITADVRILTEDEPLFAWNFPTYVEDRPGRPPAAGHAPAHLANVLRQRLQAQAERLALDTAATTRNIRASAELRQAIANTRLQRVVVAVSVLALAVAILTGVLTDLASR